MMVSMEVYLRRRQRQLQGWTAIPAVLALLRFGSYFTGGFFLSAASLGNIPQPLVIGLCCSVTGWRCVAAGLGSTLGYHWFWQEQGLQGILWAVMGTLLGLFLRPRKQLPDMPLLMPALACFLTCLSGFLFQVFWLEEIPFGSYVCRTALAGGSVLLFEGYVLRRGPVFHWLCGAVAALALARISPLPWINLGCLYWGFAALHHSPPGAILVGLGLDLAGITPVSMCAAICLACCLRQIPLPSPVLRLFLPCGLYIAGLLLTGSARFFPIPGLLLGSFVGLLLPPAGHSRSSGSTGHAQVQLELTAGILADTQQLLLEIPSAAIDEEALLDKVRLRSCIQCPLRAGCREQSMLTVQHLHQPLDFACRRPNHIQPELQLGREQLLSLGRERKRLREYRQALIQQYQFLSIQLRTLADDLQSPNLATGSRYRIQVSARSRSKALANGDHCMAFPGKRCRCYVLLCDGMGTGVGASHEGQTTASLLKKMLTAGFSAQQAVHGINSLLILRGQAGAVTLDLAEIELHTGKATLYKWGAPPSWLLSYRGLTAVGSTTPPPGLSMETGNPLILSLSLRTGQTLVMVSDGARVCEPALRGKLTADMPPGDIANTVLHLSRGTEDDDITVAAIRLIPRSADEEKPS